MFELLAALVLAFAFAAPGDPPPPGYHAPGDPPPPGVSTQAAPTQDPIIITGG